MKARNIIIAALTLAVVALCLLVGSQRAEKRREFEFRISVGKALEEAAQRGDLQKVQSFSATLLLGDVRYYEREFGAPSGTNRFARDFAAAHVMAQKIESQMVPLSSIFTNSDMISAFGSNPTIRWERER